MRSIEWCYWVYFQWPEWPWVLQATLTYGWKTNHEIWGPIKCLEWMKLYARQNSCVHWYWQVVVHNNRLPRRGICSGSRDLFKLKKLMIYRKQNTTMTSSGRLTGNRMWPMEWYQHQWPFVTLKVTFAVWGLCNSHTSGNLTRRPKNYDVYTWVGKRPWLVISAVLSKLKDISRSHAVTYIVDVVISRKWCVIKTLLLQTKW